MKNKTDKPNDGEMTEHQLLETMMERITGHKGIVIDVADLFGQELGEQLTNLFHYKIAQQKLQNFLLAAKELSKGDFKVLQAMTGQMKEEGWGNDPNNILSFGIELVNISAKFRQDLQDLAEARAFENAVRRRGAKARGVNITTGPVILL